MNLLSPERATKVIKSFDSNELKNHQIARNMPIEGWDAIRILYPTKGSFDGLKDFVGIMRDRLGDARRDRPVLIDVSSRARAMIRSFRENMEDLLLGQTVTFSDEDGADVVLGVDDFKSFVAAQAKMFVGYGNVELRIVSVAERSATCEVLKGGNIEAGMEVHIPSTRKPDTIFDLDQVRFDLLKELSVRHVIVSGKLDLKSIQELKKTLQEKYSYKPWLFAKIDSDIAYTRMEGLLSELEGVIVSRREMSLSINPSMIPMITKEIIQKCNDEAKIVITASEVLGSMRKNPTPTRAEVSDVANMVLDGADAIILSEEVSAGKYFERALSMLNKIILDSEANRHQISNWTKHLPPIRDEVDAVSYGAYKTAERVGAKAIVCITQHGNTALRLGSYHPPVTVIAATFARETLHRLALVRGIRAFFLPEKVKIEDIMHVTNDLLKSQGIAAVGDKIIFVSISLSSLSAESSNLFSIQQVY